jgi:hypothetical protein
MRRTYGPMSKLSSGITHTRQDRAFDALSTLPYYSTQTSYLPNNGAGIHYSQIAPNRDQPPMGEMKQIL